MARLKPGDRVEVKCQSNATVSPYSNDYDKILTLEIVGLDNFGYYLYVPVYLTIKNAIEINAAQCAVLKIDSRYIGENVLYISDGAIYKVRSLLDGVTCAHCQEFCQYAEVNQEDGTFMCWQCRKDRFR